MLEKQKPYRNEKYLKFVRSLECCYCMKPESQAHHLIGCGMGGVMGGKVSDTWTIPLCPECHSKLHKNPGKFPLDQKAECLKVLDKAFREGVLK